MDIMQMNDIRTYLIHPTNQLPGLMLVIEPMMIKKACTKDVELSTKLMRL